MKNARAWLTGLPAAGLGAALALAPLRADAQSPGGGSACLPQHAFTAAVKSVPDGRTLTLDDGREILLASIESPGSRARAALSALVAGQPLRVDLLSTQSDRYGRWPARAFLTRDGAMRLLEAELVAGGTAMVGISGTGARGGADPCRVVLLAAEKNARAARLGLWNDPDYDTKAAENPAVILGSRGRFAVIEGKVLSVRESGGTIYVNFGRRWSEDFTVTILKRIGAKFAAAGLKPKQLEGRRVRVRGFVEERGGPWIEATAPEQIEIADRR